MENTSIEPPEKQIAQYRGETEVLEYKRDRFIVRKGNKWIYYLARATPLEDGKFADFFKSPPVYEDGFFAFNRRFYPVSKRDVVRNHFLNNVEYAFTLSQLKEIYEPNTSATNDTSKESAENTASGESNAVEVHNQQSSSWDFTEEEAHEFNLAWDEQIKTLLAVEDSEEGWDFSTDI